MCEAPAPPSFPASLLRGTPISGARIQKRPLTHPEGSRFPMRHRLGPWLTGKGLTPRSSLSCSRSAFSQADTRRGFGVSGGSVLPPPGSRRQRALREPDGLCTRLVPRLRNCGPRPAGGLARLLRAQAHPLCIRRLRRVSRRRVSRSPAFAGRPALKEEYKPQMDADRHRRAARLGALRFLIRVHRCPSVVGFSILRRRSP